MEYTRTQKERTTSDDMEANGGEIVAILEEDVARDEGYCAGQGEVKILRCIFTFLGGIKERKEVKLKTCCIVKSIRNL